MSLYDTRLRELAGESFLEELRGRVVVVGGTGMIGAHLLRALSALPAVEAVAAARSLPAEAARVPGVRYLAGSALDPEWWRALPAPDFAVYLAGTTSNYLDDPLATVRLASQGVERFLDWGRGARALLYVSSGRVYGRRSEPVPIGEDEEVRLRSPAAGNVYDGAKLVGEALTQLASADSRALIVRPGNVYAPWAGRAPATSLADMVERATRDHVIRLLGPAASTRSHVHALDVADGMLRALLRGRPGRAYNLAGRDFMTNLELATCVAGAFPFQVAVEARGEGPSDHMVLSNARATSELGYEPRCDAARFLPDTVREILSRREAR